MPKRKQSLHKHVLQVRPGSSVLSLLNLRVAAGAALITVAAFIVYLPSLSGGFIWDDNNIYVTNNQIIKSADGLYRFWFTTQAVDYYPVSNSALWFEWRLWGVSTAGYHVVGLILHIVEALLVWLILRKLSIPGAFLAAVIFTLHPVNVEAVAWIAQRKDMLAMLFFLLSILWYLKMDMAPGTAHCPLSTANYFHWYWSSLAAFVLGMLSKGSAAMLPVLLLGIMWWLRPLTKRDLLRIGPFFLAAIMLTAVHVWCQTHGMSELIRSASFVQRLLGAGGVVWFYLYKALLPLELIFVYPQWQIEAGNIMWWCCLGRCWRSRLCCGGIARAGAGRFCWPGDFSAWL